jgi:hypothetical protein
VINVTLDSSQGITRLKSAWRRAPSPLELFTGAGRGTMIVGRKQKATYLGVDLAQ